MKGGKRGRKKNEAKRVGGKGPESTLERLSFWYPYPKNLLGPAFGRTDFSRIFIFERPDFFADFLAGFFLLIFVGKSAQKNPPGKSPGKSSKIYTTKILQHISADCPGQNLFGLFLTFRFISILQGYFWRPSENTL